MPTITGLKAASRRPGFVRIDVDDTTIGLLSEADVVELGIHELSQIDETDLAELEARVGRSEAIRVAYRFIAHRLDQPRKYDSACVESVLTTAR